MKSADQRRTDRVNITVAVEVFITDANGEEINHRARTLTISRHGATIILDRKLNPGLQLTIRSFHGGARAAAVVVGQIGGQPGGFVYAIASLDPSVNLWGIEFPPLAESELGLVRVLLECSACQAREVVHLNELETEVFEANNSLPRSCSQCAAWTLWKPVPIDLETELRQGRSQTEPGSSSSTINRARNKRQHVRVQTRMKACIRHPGFEDDIVAVVDISRGGLSFLSSKTYLPGSRIEIAVPYAQGRANIYVAARINRARDLPENGLTRYGVKYL